MAGRINLYTVDHHSLPCSDAGGIVTNFLVSPGDRLLNNKTFADMIAQYFVWQLPHRFRKSDEILDDDIIGFQGYRKHLDFRVGHEVKGDWVSLDPLEFRQYQIWQQDCAEPNIRELLSDCDVLTNPPFSVAHNIDIQEDFKVSASVTDWDEMERVLRRHGIVNFHIPTVTSYCVFMGNGKVFNEWMQFWWEVVTELTATLPAKCPDPGLQPGIYLPRRMAFLSERIYSLWLYNRAVRTKALPLLVCWELA